jgi:hypothetical protein
MAWVKGTNVSNASWSDVSFRTKLILASSFEHLQIPNCQLRLSTLGRWSAPARTAPWLQDHLNYINEATLVPILPRLLPPPYEGASVHAVRHCCRLHMQAHWQLPSSDG